MRRIFVTQLRNVLLNLQPKCYVTKVKWYVRHMPSDFQLSSIKYSFKATRFFYKNQ